MVQTPEEIKEIGLVYVTDSMPGFYRKGRAQNFYYEDQQGKKIKDEVQLERIRALVLPPAWTEVWIAPVKNAYLQATGIDAAKRKQYRYHQKWTSRQSDLKYYRLLEFGHALPQARKRIALDLKRPVYDERKVLAICVQLMQKTLIRVGNETYAQLYGSYGLSTLRNKHVRVNENGLKLKFVGKKGVKQEVNLSDRSLARMVKRCMEIPGQELFQYYTTGQEHRGIDSGMINNYIREITGGDFTAKDFRTWGGTLEAFRQMAVCTANVEEDRPRKKIITAILKCVAGKLGNTPAVCRSSYVYPLLLEAFETDQLAKFLKRISVGKPGTVKAMENEERVLMQFLKVSQKQK
ncbi:DNA topoisomerase IB [Pedobacter cryoconitis]|uniref:DNA topoisomerase n=1 Tax=Pedobacter cryoconitis TaxID=188932 RepID=A0A7X0J5G5_9SPHI|nr:DNA topoisomerase IB [Pedobacter cryoconitis]MBB6500187.1 DNA topoisomerase-1 [Pedobacter cryoconitis]